MEGRLEWCGHFDEGASAFHVYGAIGVENAEDDPAGSESPGVLEFFTDRVKVGSRVVEAVGVGTENHMNR